MTLRALPELGLSIVYQDGVIKGNGRKQMRFDRMNDLALISTGMHSQGQAVTGSTYPHPVTLNNIVMLNKRV